jgi:Pvc16 N-terminal domain
MSDAASLAAVTAALRNLLTNALVACSDRVGDITVSVIPPDRIVTGAEERSQLNLFMYRVASHSRLRQGGAAQLDGRAQPESKLAPLLSLELSYLVTAYGSEDYSAEILLGRAIQVFHETSVLSAERLRKATESLPGARSKKTIGPFDEIRITPQFLSFEDMSKLWSVLQSRYRPSMTYQVSAIGIRHSEE